MKDPQHITLSESNYTMKIEGNPKDYGEYVWEIFIEHYRNNNIWDPEKYKVNFSDNTISSTIVKSEIMKNLEFAAKNPLDYEEIFKSISRAWTNHLKVHKFDDTVYEVIENDYSLLESTLISTDSSKNIAKKVWNSMMDMSFLLDFFSTEFEDLERLMNNTLIFCGRLESTQIDNLISKSEMSKWKRSPFNILLKQFLEKRSKKFVAMGKEYKVILDHFKQPLNSFNMILNQIKELTDPDLKRTPDMLSKHNLMLTSQGSVNSINLILFMIDTPVMRNLNTSDTFKVLAAYSEFISKKKCWIYPKMMMLSGFSNDFLPLMKAILIKEIINCFGHLEPKEMAKLYKEVTRDLSLDISDLIVACFVKNLKISDSTFKVKSPKIPSYRSGMANDYFEEQTTKKGSEMEFKSPEAKIKNYEVVLDLRMSPRKGTMYSNDAIRTYDLPRATKVRDMLEYPLGLPTFTSSIDSNMKNIRERQMNKLSICELVSLSEETAIPMNMIFCNCSKSRMTMGVMYEHCVGKKHRSYLNMTSVMMSEDDYLASPDIFPIEKSDAAKIINFIRLRKSRTGCVSCLKLIFMMVQTDPRIKTYSNYNLTIFIWKLILKGILFCDYHDVDPFFA